MTQMDLTIEHFTQTQNNITSSQHLMEPSLKLTTYSVNKANINRYKKFGITPCISLDHNGLKLEVNKNTDLRKPINTWKLNSA